MSFIAYYRVSTQKQGRSGLSIEAQQAAVAAFTRGEELLGEFTDIEHGDDANRPQLLLAIALAKKNKATLLVAKLDRLSRSVTFINMLMDTHVKFTCCDMPDANEITIQLMAALAQWELKNIRKRIVVALGAKKARIQEAGGFTDRHGEWRTKLGNEANLTGRHLGPIANKEKAKANPNSVQSRAMASALRAQGLTMADIADRLNSNGFKAPQGGELKPVHIQRLLKQVA